MDDATRVAFSAIAETIPKIKHAKRIRFVLHSAEDLKTHEAALAAS